MARRPPSIAEQIRAALDSVFGKRRARAKPKAKKSKRPVPAPPKRAPRRPPKPARKTCGVCGESGHNARRHRSAPVERDLGPVLDEPSLPDEAHVVAEIPSAPAAPPDPPAAPAESDPAGREVEAAGGVAEDVEGSGLAAAAKPDLRPEVHALDTPRKRGPRRCTICGELGHDRRTCPSVAIIPDAATDGEAVKTAEKYSESIPPAAPNATHEARVAEFRRLSAHFPALEARARAVAVLVAQGYDPGAIAGDLQIKRFDVYELLDLATRDLRIAEERHPTPEPVLPALRDFSPIPPVPSQAHDEEPEITEEDAATSSQNIPHVGRGRGVRHCRRCGQPGHNVNGCDLDESDLAAARVQDIAAACLRLGLAPAPPPRAPVPVVDVAAPPPEATSATWDREDLDAIAAMMPDLPEPAPPVLPAEPAPPERLVRVSEIKDRHRARTMKSPYRLTLAERRAGELLEKPEDVLRPLERGDCEADRERPCPWVGCWHNNYLDVNEETGSIKINHPHLEPWQMTAANSCSLDVADRGGVTLEETGAIINCTRERIRQIEVRALSVMRETEEFDGDDVRTFDRAAGGWAG